MMMAQSAMSGPLPASLGGARLRAVQAAPRMPGGCLSQHNRAPWMPAAPRRRPHRPRPRRRCRLHCRHCSRRCPPPRTELGRGRRAAWRASALCRVGSAMAEAPPPARAAPPAPRRHRRDPLRPHAPAARQLAPRTSPERRWPAQRAASCAAASALRPAFAAQRTGRLALGQFWRPCPCCWRLTAASGAAQRVTLAESAPRRELKARARGQAQARGVVQGAASLAAARAPRASARARRAVRACLSPRTLHPPAAPSHRRPPRRRPRRRRLFRPPTSIFSRHATSPPARAPARPPAPPRSECVGWTGKEAAPASPRPRPARQVLPACCTARTCSCSSSLSVVLSPSLASRRGRGGAGTLARTPNKSLPPNPHPGACDACLRAHGK